MGQPGDAMLALALAACHPEPEVEAPPDVTWHRDVEPVLEQHCTRCHDGTGVAPFDFRDYAVAKDLAEVMLSRIDDGEMPPPAADPDCHPYQGSDWMVLPPEARDTVADWIANDRAEGDPADAPADPPVVRRTLEAPDRVLTATAGMVPQFTDGNEYRCFLLDPDVAADVFVTGIEARPDNPKVSHHALLFVDPDGGSEALVTDAASRSWTCADVQPEPEWQSVHAWAPGGEALVFPEGTGLRVPQHSQVILQMHYFAGEADPRPDLPSYAFTLATEVEREMYFLPLGPEGFTIPAGKPRWTETESFPLEWIAYGLPVQVWGVMPHMHLLGRGYDFSAVGGSERGKTCISRSDGYDFDLQPTYWFDEPVELAGDRTLKISCTWDNSADNPNQVALPPVDVDYGENTQQEMCFALMYATVEY